MELDLDRLHDVIKGENYYGRGSGQTTAELFLLVQSMQVLPGGQFAYIVAGDYNLPWAFSQFFTICNCLGISRNDITRRHIDRLEFKNGSKVNFFSRSQVMTRLRGLRLDNLYIDHFAKDSMSNRELYELQFCLKREV